MKFRYYLLLLLSVMTALAADAISGTYDDPGGGTYWGNIYVHDIAASKSYGWCTGDSEDGKMEEFRGFECSNNGKVTAENPWVFIKFRYNKKQSKGYDYQNSDQQIFLVLNSGDKYGIASANSNSNWTQTDKRWGLVNCSWDGEWFSFRFAPNERGIREVKAIQVESDSYYFQKNFWHRDYWFYIHARYLKDIDFSDLAHAQEAKIEWAAPGKVQVSADNSWLPSQLGNGVTNFTFSTDYSATVTSEGKTYSKASFSAQNNGNGSAELSVPLDKNFTVSVARNTHTKFTFEVGGDVDQSLNENAIQTLDYINQINNITAQFNQVDGSILLVWQDNYLGDQGEYQVYRTLLNENGGYQGNRELAGATRSRSFTDNLSRGLEYGKRYRYEVFMLHNSWDELNIPPNPESLTTVKAIEVYANTTPVIPLRLEQDMTVTDNVKVDWDFGNVPKEEADVTFKVHRIEPDGTVTRNYTEVTVARNAGKASFTDEKPASPCTLYGYFVQVDLADGKVHLYSDTIRAHVLGVSAVTALNVSKGTAGIEVLVKWKARQVGTKPTLYEVQRRYIDSKDWITIHEEEDAKTSYTYTDKTAEPGRYYEYRVIAHVENCEGNGRVIGNSMCDVGFISSTGVISGRVQFAEGTAVDGVRVSIIPSRDVSATTAYHSRSVQEAGNALTYTGLAEVVNDRKPFTLQMFVRPDSVGRVMTLMKAPVQLDLKYNKSKELYDLLLAGTVAGAIPARQFSQVSLICDGGKVTTFAAGNDLAENVENVSATPCYADALLNTPFINDSGASLDGWQMNANGMNKDYGWSVIDGAFASSHKDIIAYKDVAISPQLVGCTVKSSVSMSSEWGANIARVTATMYGAGYSQLSAVTICDDFTKHEEWKTYTAEFTIPAGTTLIRYQIEACDANNWNGYYGPRFKEMKMALTQVNDNCLDVNNLVLLPDFTGNVDEVRVWNRMLSTDEITADVDRLISGESNGLKSYITFDEGLEQYAFDISCTNGVPNGNDITVGSNTRPSDIVPSSEQLSAYGVTNDMGEYEIRGIPFAGSGTRYSVYPTKGIHSFNPTSRAAFIGGTSLTINNTDFIDVSSFKVSGTVRYSGTTIPVDSVSFYVDGVPCNKNGKLIMTGADGEYEIQVPIGSHFIETRRMGHSFEGAGRYPATEGETYEFLDDTHIDFFDNTLAIVAGRIVGGETEGKKPLGYGESVNNIGKAEITLTPLDHPQRLLNAVQKVSGTTVEWVANADDVPVASSATAIASETLRKGGDEDKAKTIIITTDAKTGEFSALLPPIRYKVQSIKFPNNKEVENDEMFMSVPAIDLTHPLDTVMPDTIFSVDKTALPLFKCNKKLMLTYRSQPVMDITQAGAPAGAFGTDTIVVRDAGQDVKLALYDYDEDTRTVTYNYGYPVFQMGRLYTFKIKAYEPYTNKDGTTPKIYKDMLRDSIITFDNEMGSEAVIAAIDTVSEGHLLRRGEMVQLQSNQVRLNAEGEANYKWRAGIPSLTKPFTRNMNASMVVNKQTRLWRNEGLTGIGFGVVPTGNNFITAGPSHVQMVLRDPPGDASTATWATDSITTDYTYTVRGVHNNTELGVDVHVSMDWAAVSGTWFFGLLDYTKSIHENAGAWKYDVNKTWDNHTSVTYTNSAATSTSADMFHVGRDGDVFIGYSTNYIIGAADKVGLYKDDKGKWTVDMRETIAMDEKFNTHFEYSQKYIETTLFDNITRTRNSMLKHITSAAEIEENPAVPTYYTYLKETDAKFGSLNSDETLWGTEAKNGFDGPSYWARFPEGYEGCDSVRWCNEIVRAWKKTLADNEEDKLKAFSDAKYLIGNESFERGVTVNKTTGTSTKEVHNAVEQFSTGLAYKGKNGYLYDGIGAIIISNTDIGYHQTKYDIDETTTNERFSYTLNDTQRGNAHTVDIYKSPRNWGPIFRTRGGQTRCPYEGETKTKYYRPGQTLDYATMRLDNPKISMPVRNFVDIPAGQEAQVQVVFANESEVHKELSSVLLFVKTDSNPNGLQVFMDGQSLLNGTELWLQYGVPLTKTLTIKQSDNSILDYNDVTLVIANTCNPALWTFGDVSFSAHFVPAAPNITLKLDKNILNERAVQSGEQLKVTISDINRMFTGLKGIRLKYRYAGDTQWVTAHEWLTDAKYFTDGHESDTQSMLPDDQPDIVYNLELPGIDGNYIVAAESICLFGTQEYVNTTAEQAVVRDTRGPQLLGQAYPYTGILYPNTDIYLRFNEAIRESYLTKEGNFFITGFLNGSMVNNHVALQLNGNPITTEAYIPIANNSFSANMWLKRTGGGTLLEHGTEGSRIKLDIDDSGHAVFAVDDWSVTSTDVIPADRWVFLAFSYDTGRSDDNKFSMLLADEGSTVKLFDRVEVPAYNGSGRLTVGNGLHGAMHDLALWGISRDVNTALAQKDDVVAAYLPGLVAYWRMNEGHGTTVTDLARSRNFTLDTERWSIENKSLAAHLDGTHDIEVDISTISPAETESYAIEFWFKGERDKNKGATMLSVTDQLSVGFDAAGALTLSTYDQGEHSSLTTAGVPNVLTQTDYSDGQWHHFALNVRRGMSAVAYVDGKSVRSLAEQSVPAPAGDKMYIGSILKRDSGQAPMNFSKTGHFTGDIDELRVWNASIDGATLVDNRYNEIDTATVSGLIAYLPMERERLDAGNNVITEFSTLDAAPWSNKGNVGGVVSDGVTQADSSPALMPAPLRQNLDFDFTASNDEIFINLKTLPSLMHGNTLTFSVKNVRDLADNLSETVTWSAKANYSTLIWSEREVEILKSRDETATFKNNVYSLGNTAQTFTISGLPSWMTASRASGDIEVGSVQTITFTVLNNAPLGQHTVPIYLSNADGIYSEPLVLRLQVLGNEPEWSVNPEDFESSMNVIGQIYVKDRICTNSYSRIAAFVGDKCCGVASPEILPTRDAYFVDLTIYGVQDILNSEPVSFRIYDASQGVVLSNVVTTLDGKPLTVNYQPNALIGDYDTPVKWNATDEIQQLCDLATGWNWISLFAEPEAGHAGLEEVLGHNRVFNTIKGKEGFAMNSGSAWVSDGLDTLAVGNLYKVKMKAPARVTVTGRRVNAAERWQTIYTGWNWIGPLSIYSVSVGEAFADLNPVRGDVVKSQNQVAFYDGYKWEGKLTSILPGVGYYYKSGAATEKKFHYPSGEAIYGSSASGGASSSAMVSLLSPGELPFTPVDHHQFSDNMNVVARAMNGDAELTDLCIAAFVGDECRGVATATEGGLYLLTVSGNAEESGQKVRFATIYDGEQVWFQEELPWVGDIIYGDLDEPQVLNLNLSGITDVGADAGGIIITPTLVRDVVNVRSGSLLGVVAVYTAGGACVARHTNINDNVTSLNIGDLPAGVYFVEAVAAGGNRVVKRVVKQ